jgi:hypothetical protein
MFVVRSVNDFNPAKLICFSICTKKRDEIGLEIGPGHSINLNKIGFLPLVVL